MELQDVDLSLRIRRVPPSTGS